MEIVQEVKLTDKEENVQLKIVINQLISQLKESEDILEDCDLAEDDYIYELECADLEINTLQEQLLEQIRENAELRFNAKNN